MAWRRLSVVVFAVVIAFAAAATQYHATDASLAPGCTDGTQTSGAIYRICQPTTWNGDLVLWAHGFVEPSLPVAIPEDQMKLPDGTPIASIINGLNFAFATTSYRKNGLTILEGVDDIRDLINVYRSKAGNPHRVFIVGASEGGLVTALSVERYPQTYAGGISACGPVGDFQAQINYFGDGRVLFDYFFPGLLPGTPTNIPPSLMSNWYSTYEGQVRAALTNNPDATRQIIALDNIPTDPTNPTSAVDAITKLIWYNVLETTDATHELGGQPFDNHNRVYVGSDNDLRLNIGIQRFSADSAAVRSIQNYETTGKLSVPLITMHTLSDPQVPYSQEPPYALKVSQKGSLRQYVHIPVVRYGHCQFQTPEVALSIFLLLAKAAP